MLHLHEIITEPNRVTALSDNDISGLVHAEKAKVKEILMIMAMQSIFQARSLLNNKYLY